MPSPPTTTPATRSSRTWVKRLAVERLVERIGESARAMSDAAGVLQVRRRGTLVAVDRAPDRVEAISAVTLVTKQMAESVSFYQSLGFRVLYGGGDAGFTSFGVGRGYLNLQQQDDWTPPAAPWGRVIFHVDDLDAMYERAVAAGLTPATELADASWGERFFHIRDPDGHELSFARPLLA